MTTARRGRDGADGGAKPDTPNRLSARQRREQFLDVAAAVAVERGIDAITMEGVALGAGVSKALAYNYFANRDDLIVALFDREVSQLDAAVLRAWADDDASLEVRFRVVLHAYVDQVEQRGPLLLQLLKPGGGQGQLEERQAGRGRALTTFYREQLEREYGLARDEAIAAAVFLIWGIEGVMTLCATGVVGRDVVVEVSMAMTRAGLASLAGLALPTRA